MISGQLKYVYKNKYTGRYLKWNCNDTDLANATLHLEPLKSLYGLNYCTSNFDDYIECDNSKEWQLLKRKEKLLCINMKM